jgi:hypothetical protein
VEEEQQGALNRKRFLTGLVTAGAGIAGLAQTRNAQAARPADKSPQGGGLQRVERRLAKDGLLLMSVSGVFSGRAGDSILVAVDEPRQVVRIRVTPNTVITAHGQRVLGDPSVLTAGDAVDVGTDVDSQGNRTANWAIANLYGGMAWVTGTGARSFELLPAYEGADERYTALFMPYTIIDLQRGGRTPADLRQGDYIHFLGVMDSPTPSESVPMWAGSIR